MVLIFTFLFQLSNTDKWLLYQELVKHCALTLMAQSQCRRSVGDYFWPGVVVENKESLNNPCNNPNKSVAVTLSEAPAERLQRVQNREICLKILFKFLGFYPSPTHRN